MSHSSDIPNHKVGTSEDPLAVTIAKMKDELQTFKRPKRILFVEDSEQLRMMFEKWAQEFNCHVEYAATGEDGLRMALVGSFDLIILDISLPAMSGIDVFRAIRKVSGDQPPVTFFTGTLDDSEGSKIEQIGFASFIRKPHQFYPRFIKSFFHNFGIFQKSENPSNPIEDDARIAKDKLEIEAVEASVELKQVATETAKALKSKHPP